MQSPWRYPGPSWLRVGAACQCGLPRLAWYTVCSFPRQTSCVAFFSLSGVSCAPTLTASLGIPPCGPAPPGSPGSLKSWWKLQRCYNSCILHTCKASISWMPHAGATPRQVQTHTVTGFKHMVDKPESSTGTGLARDHGALSQRESTYPGRCLRQIFYF